MWTDSTATLGICGWQALGKLRSIDTQCPWIQRRVRDRTIELVKVRVEENPSDLFTKHLTSQDRIHALLEQLGCGCAGGRAAAAPKLGAGAGATKGELLAMAGETMVWEGREFPVVECDGDRLPEALPSQPGLRLQFH